MSGGKLSEEEIEILKKNSNFTDDEIQLWYEKFTKESQKAQLDMHQFKKFFNELFAEHWLDSCPNGNVDAVRKHTFRAFDRDKNGKIDFKEFLTAIDTTCNGSTEEKLEWAFRTYDMNDNGRIEAKEVEHILTAICEMMGGSVEKVPEHSKKMFIRMDKDEDNLITKAEFVTACMTDEILKQMLDIAKD